MYDMRYDEARAFIVFDAGMIALSRPNMRRSNQIKIEISSPNKQRL
jgi:hypothetical protein